MALKSEKTADLKGDQIKTKTVAEHMAERARRHAEAQAPLEGDLVGLRYLGPKGITILSEPAVVFRKDEVSQVPKAIAEKLVRLRPQNFEVA